MSTITQTVTALPTPSPNYTTQQPTAFSSNAQALALALPTLASDINTVSGQMNTVAGEVNTNAATATTKASEASSSASDASDSADLAAASANMVGEWSALTGAKTVPLSVSHEGALWILIEDVADVTAAEPGSSASWIRAYGAGQIYARTSNVELVAEDNGKIFDVTSGTFSQTFDACANLGPNWCVYFRNTGTGTVTFDPDGSELIDGASTKVLKKDTLTMILCDGSALSTVEFCTAIGESCVVLHTGNGYGSTNTKIRRFSTAMTETGTAITYADSSADGATLTINESGKYAIHYSDLESSVTGGEYFGISVNSSELTTNIQSIAVADRIAFGSVATNGTAGSMSVTANLSQGDILRPHTSGNLDGASDLVYLSICKVGV